MIHYKLNTALRSTTFSIYLISGDFPFQVCATRYFVSLMLFIAFFLLQ